MGQPIKGNSDAANPSGTAGVRGDSSIFNGVLGYTTADGHAGVAGVCDTGKGNGIYGRANNANGVIGFTTSPEGHSGVAGVCDAGLGNGVYGRSVNNDGVIGITKGEGKAGVAGVSENTGNAAGPGVFGRGNATGVWGKGTTWHGVYGESESTTGGARICGSSKNGLLAGLFEGNVLVKGNITATGDIFLSNADFAEDFDILDNMVEAGTVMVLSTGGGLKQSSIAYDKKVAGVISGAGNYKPGIVLDRHQDKTERKPLAMVGKVYCKVDANYAPIEIGDLLTSSDTFGHAMKATDHLKAFGTIIGKALGTLESGTGLIPILVSLQ
jgi:hypothetical protein